MQVYYKKAIPLLINALVNLEVVACPALYLLYLVRAKKLNHLITSPPKSNPQYALSISELSTEV